LKEISELQPADAAYFANAAQDFDAA